MILKKSADVKKHEKYHPGGGGGGGGVGGRGAKSYQCTRELRTYRIHMCEVTIKACIHSYLVG